MSKKQTGRRFKRIGAIAANLILLSLATGSGEYRIEHAPTPEPTPAVAILAIEPAPTPPPLSMTEAPPTSEPISIAAIAGKTSATFTIELTPTTARPTPTYKSTPMPFPSDPPRLTPTRLLIPTIHLDAPIMATKRVNLEINGQSVTTWAVPDTFAAGWHYTSALPGQPGNTVINGHSNIYGEVFRGLELLQQNDEIVVYVGDAAYHYHVTERHLFREEGLSWEDRTQNVQLTMPTEDERLTLVTCAPYPRNTHRLIVVASPVRSESLFTPAVQ